MSYTVINDFVDPYDNNRLYVEGGTYPRKDSKTELTKEWIETLTTNKNSSKVPFIKDGSVKEPDEDKPVSKYTKDELKVHLDKQGIPYEENAKREDLLALATNEKE